MKHICNVYAVWIDKGYSIVAYHHVVSPYFYVDICNLTVDIVLLSEAEQDDICLFFILFCFCEG